MVDSRADIFIIIAMILVVAAAIGLGIYFAKLAAENFGVGVYQIFCTQCHSIMAGVQVNPSVETRLRENEVQTRPARENEVQTRPAFTPNRVKGLFNYNLVSSKPSFEAYGPISPKRG